MDRLSVAADLKQIQRIVIRLTLFVCCLTVSRAQTPVSVLTGNYDNDRTNANLQETTLTTSNVKAATFGKIGTFPVDGALFAQPLYASGVQIAGKGTRNVVYTATMHNSVYAIDADAPRSTIPLWQVNLGPAVPSSVLNVTDILPEIGILSTPVIDPILQVIYVVSDNLENGVPVFRIHALSLADGHEMMNGPASVAATVLGNGLGSRDDGTLSFDATVSLQRPGLALLNGTVYVAFGSHGDNGAFHGWLIGYDGTDLNRRVAVLNTSPNGYGGSIWQTGRAPAIDAAGNLYVATGNGDFDGESNFGESVLKLSGGLSILDWYTPDQWSAWNDKDLDLGSAGMILVPNTNLSLSGGKSGHLFLMSRDSMGNLAPLNTSAVQSVQVNQSGVFDMALWNSPRGPIVYVQEGFSSLQAYQIVGGRLNETKLSQTTSTLTFFSGIAVSANGNTDGTGIVWQTTADFAGHQQPCTLHAFDAMDLSRELWNSDMVPSDAAGRFVKFVAPTVVNGRVYVPTLSNQLAIYGLKTGAPPDAGPPQITAVVNGASYLDNSVTPGEVVVIFGANLGPAELIDLQLDGAGRVAALLSGTQVFFDNIAAPILYTSSNQLGAVVPFGVAGPNVQVRVMYQDRVSDRFAMPVTPAAPAIFAADGTGGGQGAVLNEDNSPNNWDYPADPGSVVSMYATGGGQTDPPGEDGKITSDLPYPKPILPVQVFIDNQPAQVLYAGAAPGSVQGVLQINARIPLGVPAGAVSVIIQVGDTLSPNTIMLVVR